MSVVSSPPSPGTFPEPTGLGPTSTIPAPTPTAPTLGTVPEVECDGALTGGDVDYGPEATGGDPDLVAATRVIRGVRWSDVIAVEGNKSGVVRDGRAVFVGSWFRSTSGGWLIHQYDACRDADVGLGRPRGLAPDAMAEVVVEGGVRVRSLPTVDATSIKYEPLLRRGDLVFIVDGPVAADGYDWYLTQSLLASDDRGPFGWVAAASREGETWIDDLEESDCPRIPEDARALGSLPEELLLHCFGGSELSMELEANVFCLPGEAVATVAPGWLAVDCGVLSGDACGACGIPIAADPQFGFELPKEDLARWALSGHFDDPAAASCRPSAVPGTDAPSLELIVHRCRTTLVLTSLTRLGDAR